MTTIDQPPAVAHDPAAPSRVQLVGSRMLLMASTVYATAACAPFVQGSAVDFSLGGADGVIPLGSAFSYAVSPLGFLWGDTYLNGWLASLQPISIGLMVIVAVTTGLRLLRRGSQRSYFSLAASVACLVLVTRQWLRLPADPAKYAAEAASLTGIESTVEIVVVDAYRFTPSLLLATVAAIVAVVGSAMAAVRSR